MDENHALYRASNRFPEQVALSGHPTFKMKNEFHRIKTEVWFFFFLKFFKIFFKFEFFSTKGKKQKTKKPTTF